ncbi:MAG: hypothetical protein K8W52_38585 [Deltaproteobacteria bacterium]|nr:hypothetical protein [Deltaproteobacteria bacterium]
MRRIGIAVIGALVLGPRIARADEPVEPPPAPAAPAGATPAPRPALVLAAEVFGAYRWARAGGASASAFDLDRAELGANAALAHGVIGELRLESFRAADDQSLLALSGDPLVVGIKRAWVGIERDVGEVRLGGRLGLIADPWIAAIEPAYGLRAIAPTALEDAGLLESSDLGAEVTATWRDRVTAAIAITNGEGRRQIEQNDGKDTTAVVSGRIATFALGASDEIVRVHVGGRDGSTGAAEVRSHRLAGALTLDGERLAAGLELGRGWGIGDRGELVATTVAGWARAQLAPRWLGAVARVAHLDPDGARADDARTSYSGGLVAALPGGPHLPRARVYALGWAVAYGAAAPPLPGATAAANEHGVSLLVELAAESSP